MPVDRPTFSESWYRVANQRPHLRSTIQTYRQQYRGQMWHVVRDPSNNQFFRLNDAAYHFVGLLDGRRTVEQVWETCNEQLGDQAPTQNEAIQLLGQLYTANLLHGEMAADAEGMFERYRKRVGREIRGYMTNFLFIRIPLIDPDHFLDAWVHLFGWVFSWIGFLIWSALLLTGGYFLVGQFGELWHQVNNILDQDNLIFLYGTFAVIKVFHEFGHGFACKKFGMRNTSGGEVHTMGIMFLVFAPVPYVDASSAWSLRSKWQRIMISAAGMYVELAIAAIAAIVWANTRETTLAHTIAYNVIFIASVSTILFNGNPLLRFDGYYILSDLVEVPNLSQRSKDFLYYLIKKYIYGAKRVRTTVQSASEKRWLVFYSIASSVYRVFISVRILMFVADKLFFLGAILAVAAVVTWVFVPLGKWCKYLGTSPELSRCRPRAVLTTAAFLLLLIGSISVPSVPEHGRAEAFVEPHEVANVHAGAAGFVMEVRDSGEHVNPDGEPLLVASNRGFETDLVSQLAQRKIARRQLAMAMEKTGAERDAIRSRRRAIDKNIEELRRKIERLRIVSPIRGVWVAPGIDRIVGAYVRPGDFIGRVASEGSLFVRALAGQTIGPWIDPVEHPRVEMRIKGRPEIYFTGKIFKVLPAGMQRLPTPSMGYAAQGALAVDPSDPEGTKTTEKFFEVHIQPDRLAQVTLTNSGTTAARGEVTVRIESAADEAGGEVDRIVGTLGPIAIELEPGESLTRTVNVAMPHGDGVANVGLIAVVDLSTSGGGAAAAATEAHGAPGQLVGEVGEVSMPSYLLPGQRVVVRFSMGSRPLAQQWWLSVRQLVQRRFQA